jgi:hypothetical protein
VSGFKTQYPDPGRFSRISKAVNNTFTWYTIIYEAKEGAPKETSTVERKTYMIFRLTRKRSERINHVSRVIEIIWFTFFFFNGMLFNWGILQQNNSMKLIRQFSISAKVGFSKMFYCIYDQALKYQHWNCTALSNLNILYFYLYFNGHLNRIDTRVQTNV